MKTFKLFLTLFLLSLLGHGVAAGSSRPEQSYQLYLPLIIRSTSLNPTADIELDGGFYTFESVNIPAGVTVTLLGDTTIQVLSDTTIDGSLVADCFSLTMQVQGDLIVSGTVDNRGSGPAGNCGDLTLHTNATLALGTPTNPANIQSDGGLDIANAPDLPEWEFDILPDQRSTNSLAPVCTALTDTLSDIVLDGFPIEVSFSGQGADPDGGPVSYAWGFGDGGTADGPEVLHAFTTWGQFDVTLTVTDDENQSCQANLRLILDDDGNHNPLAPAGYAGPFDLVVAIGEEALFESVALDNQDENLNYEWDFGDGTPSDNQPNPSHVYTAAGRYPITLLLSDPAGHTTTLASAIYVYPTVLTPLFAPAGNCLFPGPNAINVMPIDLGKAPAGTNGRHLTIRARGDIYLMGGTFHAQDGGDGNDNAGSGTIFGGRGGRGGNAQILVAGDLTICGGVEIAAGDGGDGGDATSNTPAPGLAWARSGNGGEAARLLRIAATGTLEFESTIAGTPVTLNPGRGGDGGIASAIGQDGDAQCPTGEPGATAKAYGGNGGRGSKFARVNNVVGLANIMVEGGQGGQGGPATAIGGNGGNATCLTIAQGGMGRPATARGGRGGNATLSGAGGFGLAADAFQAGQGGAAVALAGWGGNGIATPPGGTMATGGQANTATATGGEGGKGRLNGNGGNATATGGWGGDALAIGETGLPCAPGGSATAMGGRGGDATARYGKKGGNGATDGTAIATARAGGDSEAVGGPGGDCPTCPAGKGGDGGPATATGGRGGNGTGNGTNQGGDGGNSLANGGQGGNGADCCNPPQAGGNGGMGGTATSTAGQPGTPAGTIGSDSGSGGNGGDGGDGQPVGAGGAGGPGTGSPIPIPSGLAGQNGLPCPGGCGTPNPADHGAIPPGAITPGNNYNLTVYLPDHLTPIGQIIAHFMTQNEFGGPVFYQKNEEMVMLQSGGIVYDLTPLLANLAVTQISAEFDHSCGQLNCVQLIGLYQGNPVGMVGNGQLSGHESLTLPPPPAGTPYYDAFIFQSHGPLGFNDWGITLSCQANP